MDRNDPNVVFGGDNEDDIDIDSSDDDFDDASLKRAEENQRDQDESIRVVEEELDDENVGNVTSYSAKKLPNQDSIIPNREGVEEQEKQPLERDAGIHMIGKRPKVIEEDDYEVPFT